MSFLCPYHDDHHPSGSINIDTGAWRCYACGESGGPAKLAERLGVRVNGHNSASRYDSIVNGKLLPPGVPAAWGASRAQYVGHWTYKDASGSPIGLVVRYQEHDGKKQIIPFFRRNAEGWKAKGPRNASPLFCLDLLSKNPSSIVIIVEGEKCASAINVLGIPDVVATTSQGGAQSARKTDWSPLAGRKVAIWPDNDGPGIRYQNDVLGLLSQLDPMPSVRVLDATRLNLQEGGDVVDYLKQHPDADIMSLEWQRRNLTSIIPSRPSSVSPAQPVPSQEAQNNPAHRPTTLDDLLGMIDEIESEEKDRDKISAVVNGTVDLEPYEAETVAEVLGHKIHGLTKWRNVIRRTRRDARRKTKKERAKDRRPDPIVDCCDWLLEHKFPGNTLLYNRAGWFAYCGTHWNQIAVEPDLVAIMGEAIDALGIDAQEKTVLHGFERPLMRRVPDREDRMGANRQRDAVINCKNMEIHFDKNGGYVERAHSPESYLMACLDVARWPAGDMRYRLPFEQRAPKWHAFLRRIWTQDDTDEQDVRELIDHWHEVMAYAIQPRKNIPICCLFHGHGRNGKTTLLEITKAFVGQDAVLSTRIHDFDGRNAHAFAPLVGKLLLIDDDFARGATLPDDFIKKVSENKSIEANPKHKAPFPFRATATIFIASNHWPFSADVGYGMTRRLAVFPFRTTISDDEINPYLAEEIISEESEAILSILVESYSRLCRRGQFVEPKICKAAKEKWIEKVSNVERFVKHECDHDALDECKLQDAWDAYVKWCDAEGINKPGLRRNFCEKLEDLKYEIIERGGVKWVIGLKPRLMDF